MNYEDLSDAELDARLAKASKTKPIDKLSDEELDARIAAATNQPKKEEPMMTGKGLMRGALQALPTAGGLAGGALGLIGGPIGGVAGAGIGAAGGKALQTIGESLMGDEKTREEVYLDPLKEGLVGASGEGAGQIIGKVGSKVGSVIGKGVENLKGAYNPIQGVGEAAERLGTEATPGMLAGKDTFMERLESSLGKSPSVMGRAINNKQAKVYGALERGTEKALEEGSNLTPFQMGEKVKSGITAKIGERLDPISAVFDEVATHTEAVPISPKSIEAVSRNIRNIPAFRLTEGAGAPGKYVDMLSRAKNASDMKTISTLLGKEIQGSQGAERQVLMEMQDKVRNLETNSIMRSAIQAAKDSAGAVRTKTGESIGRELVGDLRDARKGYKGLMTDIGETARDARLPKAQGPGGFLNQVEAIPSERIQDKFFNPDNLRQVQGLEKNFPDEFALLRQGKIGDIAEKSTGKRGADAKRFLREVDKLNPEIKDILFKEQSGLINDIGTVSKSIPENFNPSGTASETLWHSALKSNLTDIPSYLLYKSLPGASKAARGLIPGSAEGLKGGLGLSNRALMMELLRDKNGK